MSALRSLLRFKSFHFAGGADDFAHGVQGIDFTGGADLGEEVAQDGRFYGTGDDGALASVGGELVEQFVARTALHRTRGARVRRHPVAPSNRFS